MTLHYESSFLSRVADNLGKCLPKCHHFEDKDMKGKKYFKMPVLAHSLKKKILNDKW